MDILTKLERTLAETPEHQHLTAPLTRKQLVAVIAEIQRLRHVSADRLTAEADAMTRTSNNPNE